jgi:hypothetical protein
MEEKQRLEVAKRIEDINKRYKDLMGDGTNISFSCLLMGIYGSGKTRCSCTGRLPILIDVFDPRGTLIFHTDPYLNEKRKEGKIIIRPFWEEKSTSPTQYENWSKQWEQDCSSGFLSMFGTYILDSGTTWIECMTNYIIKKKMREKGNLEIQDYIPMYNMIMDMIRISSSQGCDFIYNAHLLTVEDPVTGKITTVMDTYSRLKSKIPKLFSEKYVICKKASSTGPKHILLTHATGMYEASSQLGASGKIQDEEEPDLKKLMEKAGLSTTDKPIIWKK